MLQGGADLRSHWNMMRLKCKTCQRSIGRMWIGSMSPCSQCSFFARRWSECCCLSNGRSVVLCCRPCCLRRPLCSGTTLRTGCRCRQWSAPRIRRSRPRPLTGALKSSPPIQTRQSIGRQATRSSLALQNFVVRFI